MYRPRAALAALLALLLILTACSGSDSTAGDTSSDAAPDGQSEDGEPTRLTVLRGESFDGWVLDGAAAYGTYQTHPAVLEPLLRFASDGIGVEPGLADSWEYDAEAFTWTFDIRDDANFSDGSPVTADDVVFSFGIWASGFNFGLSFAGINDVVAVDDKTVQFVLGAPADSLPALLSGSVAGIMPADFGGMTEDEYYANPIGAGPYVVADWSTGGQIRLERNSNYYNNEATFFDEIVIDVVPDANEQAILFEGGQADVVEYVSAPNVPQYPEGAVVVTPPSQVQHLSLNVLAPPLDDIAVRQAIAAAVNYDSIVNGPFEGFATEPTGFLAPNLANWAPPTVPYFSTDSAAAATLLEGSPGAGASLELIYDAAATADALSAQIIQANLAEIGIEVTLTGLETLAFLDRAFTLDADMMIWSYGAISPDISDPLGWIIGTGYLFTGDDDTSLIDNQVTYLTAVDEQTKLDVIAAIQDEAIERSAAISLAEYPTLHAVATDVTGFAPAPWGLYYWDTMGRG